MFRIVTLNANGIRSADRKGLMPWIARSEADVVCLQEVKAHEADLPDSLLRPPKWNAYYHCAQTKGYSGTALLCKTKPKNVEMGFGNEEFDREGRYVSADFAQTTVISVYFPSGSSSPERQQAKFRFLDAFWPHLNKLRASGREVILCGDVNIAHKEIDLKNWRSNRKNSGFLPEERAWLDRLFGEQGWVDVFRQLDERAEQYTWWSSRGRAWDNNVGWRIDYHLATPGIAAKAKNVEIFKRKRFSDHAPLIIDYTGRL
jgi:exodeoxyribonuclease-3